MAPARTGSGIVVEAFHILIHLLSHVERKDVLMKNNEVRTTVKNKTELMSQPFI